MKQPIEIYCDGGIIGRNPSDIGGTWCFCWVDNKGVRYHEGFGSVHPGQSELIPDCITNNFTEMYAAYQSLQGVGSDWEGTLYTDSIVTLYRLTKGKAFKGIPEWLAKWAIQFRKNRKYKVVLVGGHPNKNELALGMRKDGKPVSLHNVWCDKTCTFIGKSYQRNMVEDE